MKKCINSLFKRKSLQINYKIFKLNLIRQNRPRPRDRVSSAFYEERLLASRCFPSLLDGRLVRSLDWSSVEF